MKTEIQEKNAAALAALLQGREGERHAVVLQDFPDPDAISCGLAYRRIAEAMGVEADLIYGGRISHQENIAMSNLLDIQLESFNDKPIPKDYYQGSVFVDNQGTTSNLTDQLAELGVPVLAVVDHHTRQNRLEPLLCDLRPEVGACATIFAHYLKDGLLPMLSGPRHRQLATALTFGIISDTRSMIHAHAADFNAAAYLRPFCDSDLLVEIVHQQRSHRVMEVIRLSLDNRVVREGFCLSGVGTLRANDRDAIPQAADFLLSEETVHTAIVYGMVVHDDGAESIHGSLRTTKHSLIPDLFLKEALGRMNNGLFYGGGKSNAGGFEIPLGFLSGEDSPELNKLKWDAFRAKIQRKIFVHIGVEAG